MLKIKNTEVFHEDYENLNEALASMQQVATYINEIKRRRELSITGLRGFGVLFNLYFN